MRRGHRGLGKGLKKALSGNRQVQEFIDIWYVLSRPLCHLKFLVGSIGSPQVPMGNKLPL